MRDVPKALDAAARCISDFVRIRNGTRILCNPRGYATVDGPQNPRFQRDLVIEIRSGTQADIDLLDSHAPNRSRGIPRTSRSGSSSQTIARINNKRVEQSAAKPGRW